MVFFRLEADLVWMRSTGGNTFRTKPDSPIGFCNLIAWLYPIGVTYATVRLDNCDRSSIGTYWLLLIMRTLRGLGIVAYLNSLFSRTRGTCRHQRFLLGWTCRPCLHDLTNTFRPGATWILLGGRDSVLGGQLWTIVVAVIANAMHMITEHRLWTCDTLYLTLNMFCLLRG